MHQRGFEQTSHHHHSKTTCRRVEYLHDSPIYHLTIALSGGLYKLPPPLLHPSLRHVCISFFIHPRPSSPFTSTKTQLSKSEHGKQQVSWTGELAHPAPSRFHTDMNVPRRQNVLDLSPQKTSWLATQPLDECAENNVVEYSKLSSSPDRHRSPSTRVSSLTL